MTQARPLFSNDDAARLLNRVALTPSRIGRNLARKDYAQMHNGRSTAQTRGRSASPSPTNRPAPARARSPLPSSSPSKTTIEPSDSISQASQRVPDIITKTWKKKPRAGIRGTFSNVYNYFETVTVDDDV